jgi:hypothetical protein
MLMPTKTPDRGLPAQKKRQAEFLKNKSQKTQQARKGSEEPALKGQQQTAQKSSMRSR